ncbi:MAG: class II aldolase/adducin family protein [Gordonia sp. (in: high G+C Gram-positive bacteria)]
MSDDTSLVLLRERVAAASRRLGAAGLFIGTAGNVSARDGDRVAITATGADLASAAPEDVSVVSLDGEILAGEWAPSSELELHLGVYHAAQFTSMTAVVHTHSPIATALSTVIDELPVIHYQQLLLGGSLRVAPFATFGTAALAEAVHDALAGKLAALMANHGAVTLGPTLDKAVENAELLEWLCELFWRAASIGTPRTLNEAQQLGVVEHALRISYGAKGAVAHENTESDSSRSATT